MAIDPVCGMTVDPAKSPHRFSHAQMTYHFCSAGCRGKFAADPDKYLHGAAPGPTQALPEDTIYTCPMHPEVRQAGPGACPICGMALEPEAGGADDGGELAAMTRRLWISTLLALPVVALDMGGHFGLWHLPGHISAYAELVLATPVVLWGGWPFFVRGAQSLVTRNLNMFTLIAMGTGVAYGYSIVAALAARPVSRGVSRCAWRHCALFRSCQRHHRAGAARPGARIARPRLDLGRDPRAHRARAQNRAAHQG